MEKIMSILEYTITEIARVISMCTIDSTCFFASYQPKVPEKLMNMTSIQT